MMPRRYELSDFEWSVIVLHIFNKRLKSHWNFSIIRDIGGQRADSDSIILGIIGILLSFILGVAGICIAVQPWQRHRVGGFVDYIIMQVDFVVGSAVPPESPLSPEPVSPPLPPPPSPSNKLFLQGSGQFIDNLALALRNAGFDLVSDQPGSALVVDIQGPQISRAEVFAPRHGWTYTATAKMMLRQPADGKPISEQPFSATTEPSVYEDQGAPAARNRLAEKIAGYLRDTLKGN
jgi:hypothetical protein